LGKAVVELHPLLDLESVVTQGSTHQLLTAAVVEVVPMVVLQQIGFHLAVADLQLDCQMQQKLQLQLVEVVVLTDNAVLAVAEQADYQLQHLATLELVERNPLVELVEFPATVILEQLVQHSKVEIQEMKVAAAAAVTLAAAAAETTLVVLADLVTLHF
jgi:hypothetical protein